MTNLTAQQQAGIEKIKAWHADGGFAPFRLMGPAGTGKTTMAREIPTALGLSSVYYGTFTGKAAHVLRSKGAQSVSTIHSAIYFPTQDAETRASLEQARRELDDMKDLYDRIQAQPDTPDRQKLAADAGWASLLEFAGAMDEVRERVAELETASRRMAWEWNENSDWASADLIILDEVSMVGPKLAQDIEAYGVPILVLGDPAQLPPVEGGGYYTEATPDHLLTEIHRQALESPVLELATRIRQSTDSRLGMTADDCEPASIAQALQHDQVICWSNKRRWALIKAMRSSLGYPPDQVVTGDRVMCLTNNKDLGVFNGQQFLVHDVQPAALGPTLTVEDDEGRTRAIPTFSDGFLGQEMQDQAKKSGAGIRGGRMLATFSQAITCHKSQGSEWASVYVVDETPSMISMVSRREGAAEAIQQARRWMYTAVSRASESVTVTAARRG